MDMFVVPTISFRPLYGLLILRHSRRELLWLGVTDHPNAAMDCAASDRSMRLASRHRDISFAIAIAAYGATFIRRLQGDGHSRSSDLGTVAMAERIRGEAHRLDPTGLP